MRLASQAQCLGQQHGFLMLAEAYSTLHLTNTSDWQLSTHSQLLLRQASGESQPPQQGTK
jgi:hypothetical protein